MAKRKARATTEAATATADPPAAPVTSPSLPPHQFDTLRVVELAKMKWSGNPREMAPEDMEALKRSISTFGVVEPVVVNRRSGRVVGGHQRIDAMVALGVVECPVSYVDLDDEAEVVLNIALNKIGAKFKWDMMTQLLKAMGETDRVLTGFHDVEVDRLLRDGHLFGLQAEQANEELRQFLKAGVPQNEEPPPAPEPPDKATTRTGDLWRLGNHRLLCGDSSKAVDLDRLLGGQPIHLVNTDPPYNVKVEPRSNNAIAAGLSSFTTTHHQGNDLAMHPGKSKATHKQMRAKDRPLQNDFVTDEAFDALLDAWFSNIARVLLPGRSFYAWAGYSNIANYPPALKSAGLYFAQAIIWVKEHPVLTRKDFMGNHEMCFYGWKEGAGHEYFGPNNETDVWSIKKLNPQSMVHLTEKPVELAERAIHYSSRKGENVLDLFGGSGSTLIGCERTERNGFLMELDAAYCDVILMRYAALTGKQPVLEETGETFEAVKAAREAA